MNKKKNQMNSAMTNICRIRETLVHEFKGDNHCDQTCWYPPQFLRAVCVHCAGVCVSHECKNLVFPRTWNRNMSLAARLAQTSRIAVRAARTPIRPVNQIDLFLGKYCNTILGSRLQVMCHRNTSTSTFPRSNMDRFWMQTDSSAKCPNSMRRISAKRVWCVWIAR